MGVFWPLLSTGHWRIVDRRAGTCINVVASARVSLAGGGVSLLLWTNSAVNYTYKGEDNRGGAIPICWIRPLSSGVVEAHSQSSVPPPDHRGAYQLYQ